MEMDDDVELVGERLIDRPVDSSQERFVDAKGRTVRSVRAEPYWQAYVVESGRGVGFEMPLFEGHAPRSFLGSVERIAEIHASHESVERRRLFHRTRWMGEVRGTSALIGWKQRLGLRWNQARPERRRSRDD